MSETDIDSGIGISNQVVHQGIEAPKIPIVDSSLTLEQALSVPQESTPPAEILARQRLVDVQYYSFDGLLHQGQIVIDADLVDDTKVAFEFMKDSGFPVQSVKPMGIIPLLPEADRPAAWKNSIGFNYRRAVGKESLSSHSLGRSFDINPHLNPYVKGDLVVPPDAVYDPSQPGAISADSPLVAFMKDRGWEWGGDWPDRKDYMHFQKNAPQAIFVLGGGNRVIEEEGKDPMFTTSPYKGKFFPRMTGGAKARPYAALDLAQKYPGAKIVTLSQRPEELQEKGPIKEPPFASVMAEDLMLKKVDKSRIIEQTASTSTLTEFMEVVKLSAEFDLLNVDVVVSDFQLERAQLLLDTIMDPDKYASLKRQLRGLFTNASEVELFEEKMYELEQAVNKIRSNGSRLNLVSAEEVLRKRSGHYATLIDQVRKLEGYSNVQNKEKQDVDKIKRGEFNFAQPTFRQYIMSLN